MEKYQKPIGVMILMLLFTALFLFNTKRDFPLIFQKDLRAHDESSNSVVAANITRKFFPPMVRVNPLIEQQGNWMEGPFWQHIPPLFAYVPYIFFKLDGQITIEVKRLAYALLVLLTGLFFIFGAYKFSKSLWAAGAATAAAIFWIHTPFTHELITGYAFGVSDIVLAFTVVCGFCAILWYLARDREERINYPTWKFASLGLIMALPIMSKNLLGAIPAATYFGLLAYDHKSFSVKLWKSVLSFLGLLTVYYGSLYLSSPQTFQQEIIVPIFHLASGYEGWGRPWHWYITNYLPQRYLFGWTWVYYLGLMAGLGYWLANNKQKTVNRHDKILLALSGGWFLWNLLAVSLSEAKIPNFIYQSYLLSLFFIVYSMVVFVKIHFEGFWPEKSLSRGISRFARDGSILVLVISIFVTGYETVRFADQFNSQRAAAYNYQSEHEKFYQIAEHLRAEGIDQNDLVIVHNPPNDCWLRYYILFLTGPESKTLLEMHFNTVPYASIQEKYRDIYFLGDKLEKINVEKIIKLIAIHQNEIQSEIKRVKKDKSSCQWLVPDVILNAP